MRIALFGDSFADDKLDGLIELETSWINVLRDAGHVVINHSVSGTSLYHAYSHYINFLKSEEYKQCDLVIFVITGPGREEIVVDGHTYCLTSVAQLEVLQNNITNIEHQKILEAVKIYWAFCRNRKKEELMHDLMIRDIKAQEKMLYLETYVKDNKNCLTELSRKELSLLTPLVYDVETETAFMKKYVDRRKCHFTTINNKMIGRKILQAINDKQKTVEFNINDIKTPVFDVSAYFEKR
jgi:hypothetical protein